MKIVPTNSRCTAVKKAHTVKTLIISATDRYIHFASKGWVGKAYDYNQLKDEFSPDQSWFTDWPVRLDLGYLGFGKDYACQSVSQPAKKTKKAVLSAAKKMIISKLVRAGFMLNRL